MGDGVAGADVEDLARRVGDEPDGRSSGWDGRGWWRVAAVGALVAAVVGVVVLTGGEPGGTATAPPADSVGDDAGAERGGQGREVEVRTEEIGEVDAPVAAASTAELAEDIYCWWEGHDAEKCHVWAVESKLGTFSQVVDAGGRVFVAVEGAVVALDGSDGAVLWTWRDAVPTLVAATADRVLVTDGGGRTVALDAATGTQVWEVALREGRWVWQSVGDGVVVNREPSSMALFAAGDGRLLWERRVQSAGGDGTPVIAEQVIVTVAGEALVGYSRTDGDRLWQAQVTPTLPPVYWPGGELIIVAEHDRVSAVDAATGAQVWTLAAEGVEHLADVDADTIAIAMPDRVDLVDRRTGTNVIPLHASGLHAIQSAPDGGFFARAGLSGVQRWHTGPLRPSWSLHARMPTDATYTKIDTDGDEAYVVATVGDGTTLVAFHVSERERDDLRSAPSCDGAYPSWRMGRLTAWAGEQVHAAVLDEGPQPRLWIGMPGQSPATTFTVSARPLDTTGEARFSHFSDNWQHELHVDSGGRTAADYPPHWVVAAEFSDSGCWEIRISGDQIDDTVVLPLPAAKGATG